MSIATPPPPMWQPPSIAELQTELPQYEIEGLLGRGGMGAVYKARQVSLDREVAIKVLPPAIEDGGMHYAERFIAEARSMAKLDHPGIIAVYDAGQTGGGLLYFVMAYVQGTDVAQMLAQAGRLPPQHAHAITAQVCDALAYAHAHQIIHRDIKPANIMVDRQGRVKVADFGLANAANEHSGFTIANIAVGTPDYVAPEALISGMLLDGRADVYAVGVMLYQMLTGQIPRGAWQPASVIAPGVDPRFDQIIFRAMQYDRDARHSSTLEMRQHLDTLFLPVMPAPERRHQPNAVTLPSTPHAPCVALKPTPQVKPVPRSQPKPKVNQPRSKTPLFIGLAAAACMAVTSFFLFSSDKPVSQELGTTAGAGTTPTKGFTNSLGMKFIPIPGTLVLFCLHETRHQDYAVYAAAMKGIAGNWKNQAHDGFALSVRANEHPVVSVSWDDAQAFCKWLSKQEGKTYRLPTDREWSTAAGLAANEKSGQTDFPWGGVWPPPNGAGNYSDRSRKAKAPRDGALYIDDYDDAFPTTAPVMSFKPNKLGLFDLGGNALEWCDDWFNKDHIERILRGGSWHNADPVDLFSINRRRLTPGSRHNNLGFRVVMVTSAP